MAFEINVAGDYRTNHEREQNVPVRWAHECRIVLPEGTTLKKAASLLSIYQRMMGDSRNLTLSRWETRGHQYSAAELDACTEANLWPEY